MSLWKSAAMDFFIGIVLRDSHQVVEAVVDMGAMTPQSDIKSFENGSRRSHYRIHDHADE